MKRPDETGLKTASCPSTNSTALPQPACLAGSHEVSSAAKWLGSEFAKAENAVASALGSSHVNITIHRQN
ncbi:hypothetical protein JJC00_33065 [Bradyrhizobium diazoefficiens]|uniref:hypothetical protein n=1 Tax=Bradyrhizobium diazoefficiens TaxID=1355477 RepID=UPI00190BF86F|nr:hypothetical protein [Bradyrhizobium diazoefficiens]QQO33306.1 hypothetical protein JJC00_33065 [Bradyrhizobium diazoefficiens]